MKDEYRFQVEDHPTLIIKPHPYSGAGPYVGCPIADIIVEFRGKQWCFERCAFDGMIINDLEEAGLVSLDLWGAKTIPDDGFSAEDGAAFATINYPRPVKYRLARFICEIALEVPKAYTVTKSLGFVGFYADDWQYQGFPEDREYIYGSGSTATMDDIEYQLFDNMI